MLKNTSGKFVPLQSDVNHPAVRSAREEWQPHQRMTEKSLEWWYVTSVAYDGDGNRYFILFAVVHYTGEGWHQRLSVSPPAGGRVAMISASLHDYQHHDYRTFSTASPLSADELWNEDEHALESKIGTNQVKWSYTDNEIALKADTADFSYDFHLSNVNEVVWHKDNLGVEGMIQQGAEDDRSFYYSLMRTPLHGSISIPDAEGNRRTVQVTGSSWVDRQWGEFYTLFWEWSSFRFDNGARLHLYSFYNGHQEAAYLTADGQVHYFDTFILKQNGYRKSPTIGIWVSWGWSYEFPIEIEGSKHFTVEPYTSSEFVETPAMNYALYEGACRLINDETGALVGVTVNESADIRQMKNGPYAENQR